MEAAIAFELVLGFLVGALTLALVIGCLSTEHGKARERAQRQRKADRTAEVIPSFFARPVQDERRPEVPAFDDALLARLESHVRQEQALVSQFVRYPSIDSLYRQAPPDRRRHGSPAPVASPKRCAAWRSS